MKTLMLSAMMMGSLFVSSAQACSVHINISDYYCPSLVSDLYKKTAESGHTKAEKVNDADFEIKLVADTEYRKVRKVIRTWYVAIDHRNAGVELGKVLIDEDNIGRNAYYYNTPPSCHQKQAVLENMLISINQACAQK